MFERDEGEKYLLQVALDGKAKELRVPFKVFSVEAPIRRALAKIIEPLPTPTTHSKVYLAAQEIVENNWRKVALLLVRNRFKTCSKKAFPYYHSEFSPFEAWADVLDAQLDLCDGCLELLPSGAVEFADPCSWWQALMLEEKQADVRFISEERPFQKNSYKTGWKKDERKALGLLRKFKNPYCSKKPMEKHRYNLINIALVVGKERTTDSTKQKSKRKAFREKYWGSYLAARRRWLAEIAKDDWKFVYVSDGKLYKQISGKERDVLYPKPTTTFRGGRGKKSMNITLTGYELQLFASKR